LGLLLAVSTGGPAPKRKISVSLSQKEIRDVSREGLTLSFYLEVANTSSTLYSLAEYDYRVVVEGIDFFTWKTAPESPIPVERNSRTRLVLPVKISYADLFQAVKGIEARPKVACYVTGLMIFIDVKKHQEKIPFAFSGEFPIYRDLEVRIQPLTVKTLSIGGAEFIFSFACRNPNGFELGLGNLGYQLELDGKKITEGEIPGPNTITAEGEKTFSLPVMLDFFEVGKEFYPIFDKAAAACRLSLGAAVDSNWGSWKIAITQEAKIQVAK
jgi:LEA14-like dessication related protein